MPIGESKPTRSEWIFFHNDIELPFPPFIGLEFGPYSDNYEDIDFVTERIDRVTYSVSKDTFYCYMSDNTAIQEEIAELLANNSSGREIAEILVKAVDDYISYYTNKGWQLSSNSIESVNKVLKQYYNGTYTYKANL